MKPRTADLRKLARRQRWILWLLLAGIFVHLLPQIYARELGMPVFVIAGVLQVVVYLFLVVGVVLLLTAQGNHPLMTIMCGILMLAPCANLLLLLLVNMSVTRTLRRAGLPVGFMGVRDEDVERVLNPMLCKGCSYDLTGNISGRCPECGRLIEPIPIPSSA